MTLTLEQWKEILDTVNPDKGDILKQIKENSKKDHDRIYKIFKIKDFGINDEFPLESGRVSLLHIAASNGKSKIVEYLIGKGVDVNVRDHNDNTPLHLAVRNGCLEVVKALLEKNAKVDITNNYGDTPLHDAASNGYLDIVKALLEQTEVNVDVKNNYGNTLLHLAARNGHSEVVAYLISKGAKIDISNNDGNTPLHRAVASGHLGTVQVLLEQPGVNVDVKNNYGNTPLHWAARYSHSKIVACLINKRAKVDITNNYGDIPLHDAASNGYLDIVKALLEQTGVNVDVKNNYGNTLLHLAARNGHSKVVAYLIGKKAKVNITNDYDDTPLHDAASNGYLDIVKALLEQTGVNVDVKNNYGNTPLHWAARNGHSEVVAYLISKRAKVDITNDYSETALHWAAFKGRKDVVIALFSKGANPLIKSKDGKTPRDLTNDENIIQLLKEAETKHIISKSIMIGSVCGVVASLAAGGGCFAVDVALPMLALIGIAVSAALVIGAIAGGISHVVLRPSDDECLSKPQKSVVNSPKSQNKVQSQISDQEPKTTILQHLPEENLVSKADTNVKLTENSLNNGSETTITDQQRAELVANEPKAVGELKFDGEKLLLATNSDQFAKCRGYRNTQSANPDELLMFIKCGANEYRIVGNSTEGSILIKSILRKNKNGDYIDCNIVFIKEDIDSLKKILGLENGVTKVKVDSISNQPFGVKIPTTTAQQTVNNTTIDQSTSSAVTNEHKETLVNAHEEKDEHNNAASNRKVQPVEVDAEVKILMGDLLSKVSAQDSDKVEKTPISERESFTSDSSEEEFYDAEDKQLSLYVKNKSL